MPTAKRTRFTLFRSTPFRLALTFAALLITAFIVTGFAIYEQMRTDLTRNLDATLGSTFAVLADTYQDDDLEDLITAVDSHSKLVGAEDQLFSLADKEGKLLGGTALPSTPKNGLHNLNAKISGHPTTEYRALTEEVGEYHLTVAISTDEIEDLLKTVVSGFGWASFAVIALAIAGGILLAFRAQRRLDAIAVTMHAVAQGQLASRIPLIGNGDDIDQMSERINTALDQLNKMVEGVRQVSNDIAHELKTPLNRLHLMIERAVAKPSDNIPILEDALSEIAQLNATFEAMLRIARIESGTAKARFSKIDLSELLRSLIDIYTEVAVDSEHVLSFQDLQTQTEILGDKDLLTQLFVNLIENSLRHTPPGTHITISVKHERLETVVEVADNGPGIPVNEHGNVLRRLYRLDKSRTTPGSGLGLSIVAAIADLHDASFELNDNAPGLRITLRFSNAG